MKQVIFYNDTGFPFSILVAAIFTGRLPIHRCPDKSELESVLRPYGLGKGNAQIHSFEKSPGEKKCLALWTAGHGDMVNRAINSFLSLYQIDNYILVNLSFKKTPVIILGTWLIKLPLLYNTGLNLIHLGIKNIYKDLVKKGTGYF